MKKKFACLLALMMTGSAVLTGCGGSSAKAPETQAVQTEAPETEAAETEAPETEAPETEAPETEAAQTEAETVSEEEALEALGSVDGNVYTNDYFGLRFEAVDNWSIGTKEEIANLSGLAADAVEDEELAEQLRTSGAIYDFYAQDNSNSDNINIVLQDIGLYGNMLSVLGPEELIEQIIPQVEKAYASAGYEVHTCEVSDATFKGETVKCIATHFTAQGIEMYQRQVYSFSNNYIAVITATSAREDGPQAALEMFQ